VRADDLPADSKSQAESTGLRGEECIENVFEAIARDTVPAVGNDDVQ
jgi:hypothetical protein